MRAIIYARISDDRAEGAGVRRQRDECESLAKRLGWEVVEVIEDNSTSAYTGRRRSGYEYLRSLLESGRADAVIAWHPDRLTRQPRELEDLIDLIETTKARVATVQTGPYDLSTPSGRMVARMLGAAARGESEHKGERVRAHHAQRAREGRFGGGPRPFGFERGDEPGTLKIVEAEAEAIRDAARRAVEGTASWRSIAERWNARGMKTPRGKEWHANSVRIALTKPSTAGLVSNAGEIVGQGCWEPILDRATHEALASLSKRRRGRPGRPRRLLTGLAYCGRCGNRLQGGSRGGTPTYTCRREPGASQGCQRLSIKAQTLEEFVVSATLPEIARRGTLEQRSEQDPRAAAIEAEISNLEVRREELASQLGEGALTVTEFQAARQANAEAIEKRRAQLAEIGQSHPVPYVVAFSRRLQPQPIEVGMETVEITVREDFDSAWEATPPTERRELLAEAIERIEIAPYPKDGRREFDRGRVTIDWTSP